MFAILHKWGVHTLGDLARLDKQSLGERLGAEAVLMWERANGRAKRVLKLVRPPECFIETFEFENEVETIDPLLFILRRFLEQLTLRLSGLYKVASDLTLRLTFSDKNSYERQFKIPQPTNDVDLLFRMLHTHLEDFKSEQPIVAVALEAQPGKPSQQQFGLFETALRDPAQLHETLARLTALFGQDRVGTPVREETHRPDAFRIELFKWEFPAAPKAFGAVSAKDEDGLRTPPAAALRRFRPTLPASVLLNENNLAHLHSSEASGRTVAQRGPYIASGNWWDQDFWARSEFDVQLENGALLRCHCSDNQWQVDGIYD